MLNADFTIPPEAFQAGRGHPAEPQRAAKARNWEPPLPKRKPKPGHQPVPSVEGVQKCHRPQCKSVIEGGANLTDTPVQICQSLLTYPPNESSERIPLTNHRGPAAVPSAAPGNELGEVSQDDQQRPSFVEPTAEALEEAKRLKAELLAAIGVMPGAAP